MKSRLTILHAALAAVLLPFSPAKAQKIVILKGDPPVTASSRRSGSAEKKPEATPDPAPPATLHWNNGESVTGELIGATDDALVWKSPLFDDPLELTWTAIHRIEKNPADGTPLDPFAFVLRDGSRVYGDLTGVTDTTVSIHSTRHGDAVLRRAEVIGAWRLKNTRLVYAGPWGESGWVSAQAVRLDQENTTQYDTVGKVPVRLTGPGGSLVMPFWHRTLSNSLTLPDRVDVEFHLHARDQPAFQLVLDGREKKRLRIETWGNEVVLATSKTFEKICQLDEKDRSIALRVCWDRPARRCQVYTSGGKLLTEWTVPDASEGGKPAVLLANRGHDLTLDFLRIREWDGQPPVACDGDHPRVELDDGRFLTGTVSAVEAGAVTIDSPEGSPAQDVPLQDIDAVVFADAVPQPNLRETTLSCADGTLLHGEFTGFQDGRALLKTTFTEAPLPVKIDDMQQLFIRSPAHALATVPELPRIVKIKGLRQLFTRAGASAEPPLESLDKIVVQGTTLHGHLVAAAGGTGPRWLPVGGKNPVTPATTVVSEITRVFPLGAEEPPPTSLLYTRMGDALPGVLHNLDRKEVDFDSPWIEAKTLPTSELQAIQFDSVGKGSITGFDTPGWQVIKGNRAEIGEKPGLVKLTPGAVLGHPAASQEGEVKFAFDTENYSCLRLRLFCEGTNPARSLNYILMRSNNRISSGVETSEGQFNNQHQTIAQNGPVPIRLVIDEKSVRFYVNEALTETVWYPAAKRAGAGLLLESSSVWGNAPQELTLSKFSATSPTGRSFLVSVNAEAKAQALMVPRFRKDDPPRHALLATNGDVLRGEIVALTNTQIGFRIGLETLHIPRERVAAMIALQPPVAAPPAEAGDATQKLLEKHVALQTWYSNVGYSSLLSIIRQSVPELKFQTPTEQDSQRVQFRFDNQSVGDVLDSICEQFNLRYHVDKGVIVLETRGGKPETNLVRKAYWLKTDPFVGHGSAADMLAAKDVPFPKGARADWQASSQCLEITNTAANQAKIEGLLANEFGGTLGSPTHWLLLRNGGRIGLIVEKFEPDGVRGTHPIYGRCKVPLADVYAVRNTMPEPTAAAHAVSGWRMVYAPEPVIPESGGENSEMLGKDAPTFKLKMLTGGEFDLGHQKGNIVVLDFWATWCAPCINSLPGLIETVGQFPPEKVKLVGINQAEAPEQVKRFLEVHNWKLDVAMDAGQSVAKQYGVDGIPHTVIVGTDGKVAWVQTGANPDGEQAVSDELKKLLGSGGTAAPGETPKPEVKSGDGPAH